MTRSSHPLTATCVERRAAGHSGATIARVVGRSETWVSRHLAAWDGAGRELHHAWEEGRLTDDAVMRIAALPRERQAAAVANPTQSKRSGTSASMKHKWTVRRIDAVLQIVQGQLRGWFGEGDSAGLRSQDVRAAVARLEEERDALERRGRRRGHASAKL